MKLAPRHIVAIVVSICAAAVLTPVGVMAATGTLVNIVDPVYSARKVRVGSNGALMVETRPGATPTAVNANHVDIQSLTPRALAEVTGPTRIALSEATVSVTKSGSPVVATTIVELVSYVRTSGTNACGLTGWTGTVLRRVNLNTDQTMQLKFDGPPLMVPTAPSGQRQCLAAKLYQWVGDTKVHIGATVFTYS